MNFGNPANFVKYQLYRKIKSTNNYQLYQGINKMDKTSVLVYVLTHVNRIILEYLLKFESDMIYAYQDIYLIESTAYVVYQLPKNSVFLLNYIVDNQVPEEQIWDWLEQLILYYNELRTKRLVYQGLDMSLFSLIQTEDAEEYSTPESNSGSSQAKPKYKLAYYGVCTLFNEYYLVDSAIELNAQFDAFIIGKFISGCMNKYALSQLKYQVQYQPQDQYYEQILPSPIICGTVGIISPLQSDQYSQILMQLVSYTQMDLVQRIPLEAMLSHPMFSASRDQFNILSYNAFEEKDFEVLKKIGEGGFGIVQLAKHKYSNQLVVLKSSTRVGIQKKEANLLRNLSHPNVVRLYGDFMDRNIHFIAMQYCESGDLLHYLQQNRKVPKELQLPWIAQICSALYYMHNQNLMHRDIKPENILISNNQLYISDFGISKEIVSETNTIIGTPMYFSPEVYKHSNYSFPSDVYSLGLVIYNMLTGEHIYRNTPREQAEFYNSRNYQKYVEEKMVFVSRPFRTLVFNMLKHSPADRPNMEQICTTQLIYEYLIKTGLPGAKKNSILLSARAKRPNIDLSALFARYGGGIEAMAERLVKYRADLANAFDAVVRGCAYYLRSSLNLPKTAFGSYVSQFMGVEVQELLKSQNVIRDISKDAIKDTDAEIDADVYFLVGPVFKFYHRGKRQYIFAVSWVVEENVEILDDVVIVVNNIIFYKSVQIKLNATSVLAVQKIETSKHYKISGGTVFTNICGIVQGQLPFDDIFAYSRQLQLLGEYANHCFPMLFKDNRGYWKNEGLWDQM